MEINQSKYCNLLRMKTFITSLIFILIFSGCAEKRKQEEKGRVKQEYEDFFQQIKLSLINKFNADTIWVKRLLGNESYRLSSFKTIELEKTWLHNNPILFLGYLTDISSINENNYLLEFGLSTFPTRIFHDDNIFFKVRFPKTKIDTLLQEYPELLTDYLPKYKQRILIVAKIDSIAKYTAFDKEGYTNIWYGIGDGYDLKIIKELSSNNKE
jgi:hypothetical protein